MKARLTPEESKVRAKAAKERWRKQHPYVRLNPDQKRRWQNAKQVEAANDDVLQAAVIRMPFCKLIEKVMDVSGVYCIENLVDGKKYIGASKMVLNRFGRHKWKLRSGKHENTHLQSAWNLHGESAFVFYVMAECPIDQIASVEIRLIAELHTTNRDFGYNIEWGGQQNHRISEETKRKISAKLMGHTLSADSRKKISQAHLGEKNKNFGKPRPPEAKAKSSKTHTGKPCPWAWAAVDQLSLDGHLIATFPSLLLASQATGVDKNQICGCCNGRIKTSGGYIWRHATTAIQQQPTVPTISSQIRSESLSI